MSHEVRFDPYVSAEVYDQLYPEKDYEAETNWITGIVAEHGPPDAVSILDAACGTGGHLAHLHRYLPDAVGVDISPAQLELARQRLPDQVALHEADIEEFDLGRQFDVVTCLFAAIAYLCDESALRRGMHTLARHTRPGGLMIIQPWVGPDQLPEPQQVRERSIVGKERQRIIRVSNSGMRPAAGEGPVVLDMHFMYARLALQGELSVMHFSEHHVLGAFHQATYIKTMQEAGLLEVWTEPPPEGMKEVAGQPLLIGRKPE